MPYLAIELDAKKAIPKAANACGMSRGDFTWSLLELWEHVFTVKQDQLERVVIDGCFSSDPRVLVSLVAFGFIEPVGDLFRVNGSDRLLAKKRAQSEAARLTNAKRTVNRTLSAVSDPQNDAKRTLSERSTVRLKVALTPSTISTRLARKTPATPSASRHRNELADRLSAMFEAAIGSAYVPTKADWVQLASLDASFTDDEIALRWSRGLANARSGAFPGVTSWRSLLSQWNSLAVATRVGKALTPEPTALVGSGELAAVEVPL